MVLKNKLLFLALSIVSVYSLLKLSCNNLELIKTKVNPGIAIYLEKNVCENKQFNYVFQTKHCDTLKNDFMILQTSIKTYPYGETAREYKNKLESFILNFDLQREYANLKRTIVINFEQLKHFIFLKYQLLILKDDKWKQMYAKKTNTQSSLSVTVTGVEKVLNAVNGITGDLTVNKESENNVPATNTGELTPENSDVQSNQNMVDYATLHDRVTKKAENMVFSIEKDLQQLQLSKLADMKPKYVEKIQELNDFANERMLVMSTMIREINNCNLFNESYFYNETMMECKYAPITRELFREYFKSTQSMLEEKSKNLVEIQYKDDVSDFNRNLEALKLNYVDLFEDWADSILSKLKEVLVVENLSFSDDDEDVVFENGSHGVETLEQWREFVSLKNDIIDKRDYLLNFESDLSPIGAFVDDLKKNIGLLAHEGGDRLYIIRSKANLEFQSRESAERAAKNGDSVASEE